MKQSLLFIFTLFITSTVTAQIVNIPDANFKAYLVGNSAINTNSDTEIQVSEASAFTGTIDCQYLGISDLTGIESFTLLTSLYCAGNSISTLNISNNTNLSVLYCPNTQLTSLNVTNNSLLTELYCFDNALINLDVSSNSALQYLDISYTSIANIDLSNNSQLTYFDCVYGALTSLDLSANTQLFYVNCWDNSITSITFPTSSTLQYVECYNNELTVLDLSSLANLEYLKCQNNNLNFLNLANGNNSIVTDLIVTNNPNLDCIQVDDASYSTNNWVGPDFSFDAGVIFSEDCSAVPNPEIIIVSSLNSFSQTLGTPSLEQSFTVSGSDLTDNITVTAPASYEVSLSSGSGFGNSVQINQTAGTVPNTTVHVRLNAGAVGTHTGDITLTSGALTETVAVTGSTTNNSAALTENGMSVLSVYPNPTSNHLTISILQPVTVILSNLNGSVLKTLQLNGETTLDVSTYAPGVYFIRTSEGQTVKFIKD
jgi:hypothetical protein